MPAYPSQKALGKRLGLAINKDRKRALACKAKTGAGKTFVIGVMLSMLESAFCMYSAKSVDLARTHAKRIPGAVGPFCLSKDLKGAKQKLKDKACKQHCYTMSWDQLKQLVRTAAYYLGDTTIKGVGTDSVEHLQQLLKYIKKAGLDKFVLVVDEANELYNNARCVTPSLMKKFAKLVAQYGLELVVVIVGADTLYDDPVPLTKKGKPNKAIQKTRKNVRKRVKDFCGGRMPDPPYTFTSAELASLKPQVWAKPSKPNWTLVSIADPTDDAVRLDKLFHLVVGNVLFHVLKLCGIIETGRPKTDDPVLFNFFKEEQLVEKKLDVAKTGDAGNNACRNLAGYMVVTKALPQLFTLLRKDMRVREVQPDLSYGDETTRRENLVVLTDSPNKGNELCKQLRNQGDERCHVWNCYTPGEHQKTEVRAGFLRTTKDHPDEPSFLVGGAKELMSSHDYFEDNTFAVAMLKRPKQTGRKEPTDRSECFDKLQKGQAKGRLGRGPLRHTRPFGRGRVIMRLSQEHREAISSRGPPS